MGSLNVGWAGCSGGGGQEVHILNIDVNANGMWMKTET